MLAGRQTLCPLHCPFVTTTNIQSFLVEFRGSLFYLAQADQMLINLYSVHFKGCLAKYVIIVWNFKWPSIEFGGFAWLEACRLFLATIPLISLMPLPICMAVNSFHFFCSFLHSEALMGWKETSKGCRNLILNQ